MPLLAKILRITTPCGFRFPAAVPTIMYHILIDCARIYYSRKIAIASRWLPQQFDWFVY